MCNSKTYAQRHGVSAGGECWSEKEDWETRVGEDIEAEDDLMIDSRLRPNVPRGVWTNGSSSYRGAVIFLLVVDPLFCCYLASLFLYNLQTEPLSRRRTSQRHVRPAGYDLSPHCSEWNNSARAQSCTGSRHQLETPCFPMDLASSSYIERERYHST